ncbi:MAG: hypothetical protein EBT56_10150 [Betaproteobacteria bacterium]|nr:hypothetical protein [Betaproteobacteria bacterium]
MDTAAMKKKVTYWERVRYDSSAQSSMYVVVDQGRLDLARQTFAKVRQGLDIDGLVGEHPSSTEPSGSAHKASGDEGSADQGPATEQNAN